MLLQISIGFLCEFSENVKMLKLNICIFKFKLFKNITEYFLPKKIFQAFYFSALVSIMTKTWTHTESITQLTRGQ